VRTEVGQPPSEQPPSKADEIAAVAAPEVIAGSFGEYVKIWWARVRSGDSGALAEIMTVGRVFQASAICQITSGRCLLG
jgi:hypothetical protein